MGGTELGGTVTAVETAKAKAKVETTVSTEPSKVNGLTAQVESVGSAVGGTITATVGTSTQSLESNSSNSKWSLSCSTSDSSCQGGSVDDDRIFIFCANSYLCGT